MSCRTKTRRSWPAQDRTVPSQPFFVAEVFTGRPGKYVPVAETVRGFKAILNGEVDHLPEAAFYMVGTLDEVFEKAKEMEAHV